LKLEKVTKLPEDVLEAVSSISPADRKQKSISKSVPSKPAAVDTESEDASSADDESELQFSVLPS